MDTARRVEMVTKARLGTSTNRHGRTRGICACAAAAVLSLLLAAAGGRPPGKLPEKQNFRPTPVGFGLPLKKVEVKDPVDVGILRCQRSTVPGVLSSCVVRNMPLLSQSDPRLDADVKDQTGQGCYTTAILTAALTALANRGGALPAPGGRTKELMNVPADAAHSVPKEVEQLSWIYRVGKKAAGGAKGADGNPVQAYYLTETLADFGKIKEGCDPYLFADCATATSQFGQTFYRFVEAPTWTNQDVIKRMQDGYVLFIAYERYTPAVQLGAGGKPKVKFALESAHKVVFSGFQAHKYPLLINDVGTAQQYRVRLSTDVSARRFAVKGDEANAKTFAPGDILTPAGRPVFIEYEGTGAGVNDQVFFVRHIDAIKLNR